MSSDYDALSLTTPFAGRRGGGDEAGGWICERLAAALFLP